MDHHFRGPKILNSCRAFAHGRDVSVDRLVNARSSLNGVSRAFDDCNKVGNDSYTVIILTECFQQAMRMLSRSLREVQKYVGESNRLTRQFGQN